MYVVHSRPSSTTTVETVIVDYSDVFALVTVQTHALTLNVAYVQIHSVNVKHVVSQETLFWIWFPLHVNVFLDSSDLDLMYLVEWKELSFAIIFPIEPSARFVFQASQHSSEVANDAMTASSSNLLMTHVWLNVHQASPRTLDLEEHAISTEKLATSSYR